MPKLKSLKLPGPDSATNKLVRLAAAARGDELLLDRLLLLAEAERTKYDRTVDQPDRAIRHFLPLLAGLDHERLAVLALGRRYKVIDSTVLTIGCMGFCIVDPKQIYRWALTRPRPVSAIVLAHNHPSGDPTPSEQDIEVTRRVQQAGSALGIPLLDHMVVCGPGNWSSLATLGHIVPEREFGPSVAY